MRSLLTTIIAFCALGAVAAQPPAETPSTAQMTLTVVEWTVTLEASAPSQWGVLPATDLEILDSGRSVRLSVSRPGRYAITCFDGSSATSRVVALGGDGQPGPPNPPPETDLTTFVKRLTADVEADDHGDVAAVFLSLADRIRGGDLRGSTAIGEATATALFGPLENGQRAKRKPWQAWFKVLTAHLFDDLKLVTAAEWEPAYREIAKAVKK